MSERVPPCTALVTGASRGIGRAIARALALRGVRVALHYHLNRKAADEARGELAGDGHALFAADLASPAQAADLWREASATFGRIDILVNNAGVYLAHPPLAAGYEGWQVAWRRTLATNLEGPANLSVLAAQSMAASDGRRDPAWGRGRIVNLSSRGAFRGEPDAPAYAASKAGLNALSQSLAKALAPRAVYVYCLAPGWVETDMAAGDLAGPRGPEILAQHPLDRIATASEVAGVAVYCALDAPAAMTGSIIDVNGASYLRT
ncbi:MAG TPA: SDR family oxidoreductase [Steroidobacteraceae bacterium]|nr:SDR family oxidoreductase [Steroidobacteraceae bacterium]